MKNAVSFPNRRQRGTQNLIISPKRIHLVLANIVITFEMDKDYVDGDNPQKGILVVEAFAVHSTFHAAQNKLPDQLDFGRYMIVPIEHVANWRIIYQSKQILIDKNNYRENST